MMSIALFLAWPVLWAGEIVTNSVQIMDAPAWLTASRVNQIADRVQRVLEWDIRRVRVRWYQDQSDFQKVHGFSVAGDPSGRVLAVSRKSENTIHIGPQVNTGNFDGVFGHELGHIIMFQKYKDAIPKWLEEGLANHAGKHGVIDYGWLAAQPAIEVRAMEHPFSKSPANPRYHYMASTALMEMIAAKCPIHDLLQLSVGEKLEGYLDTFCGIADLNAEFRRFLERKSRAIPKKRQ